MERKSRITMNARELLHCFWREVLPARSVGNTWRCRPDAEACREVYAPASLRNDDYATVNFYGKYRPLKGYLTIGVDNIFNEEIHISGNMSSDSTNKYVYYGFDRLFKLGYEITF